jgi:hypothetical protein
MLTDSRVVEATSKEKAQMLFRDQINVEQSYRQYSAAALVLVEDVHFIDNDPVVESDSTRSILTRARDTVIPIKKFLRQRLLIPKDD